jgi:hypothetical protein
MMKTAHHKMLWSGLGKTPTNACGDWIPGQNTGKIHAVAQFVKNRGKRLPQGVRAPNMTNMVKNCSKNDKTS